ncbi:hypothetical protein [Xanthomonas vesicatoria]|nr:hypothetical protein [Xanthomonas vesicatoria]
MSKQIEPLKEEQLAKLRRLATYDVSTYSEARPPLGVTTDDVVKWMSHCVASIVYNGSRDTTNRSNVNRN